jgi:hypothetical protein
VRAFETGRIEFISAREKSWSDARTTSIGARAVGFKMNISFVKNRLHSFSFDSISSFDGCNRYQYFYERLVTSAPKN